MIYSNFYIENKAVLIPEHVIGTDNMPKTSVYDSYTDGFICDEFKYKWWIVVVKYGKLKDACIDYSRKYDSIMDFYYCSTQNELYKLAREKYNLTYTKLREICGHVGDNDIQDYIDCSCKKIADYLAKIEEDKIIEDLKAYANKNGFKMINDGNVEIDLSYNVLD